MTQTTDLKAIADALREHDRFLVVTHENPDGDALGSLLAATLALRSSARTSSCTSRRARRCRASTASCRSKSSRASRPPTRRSACSSPSTAPRRTGSATEAVLTLAPLVLDIDHHHDNTRFGDVNLIVPDASSTGEVLRDVFAELDVELTPELAEPLYIALVTDTGRFQYSNTTPKSLRLAAELVEAGADIHAVFQEVYESVEFAKLKLLARVLERAEVLEGGRIVVSHLVRTDFADVGASEPYSEGLIDYLREVEGAELAVLVREQMGRGAAAHKGSLRSSIDELDVSAIARRFGGGGHRQAAGFSSDDTLAEIVETVRVGFLEQRAASRT